MENRRLLSLWGYSLVLGLIILVNTGLYFYSKTKSIDIYLFNKTIAWTAFFLICISMGLSSIGYLFPKFQKLLGYRKYIGLVGFWAFMTHFLISFIILRKLFVFPTYYFSGLNFWSTIFSVLAALLLILMILTGREFVLKKIGPIRWRRVLRLGYLVMFLVTIHFSLKYYPYPSSIVKFAVIFTVIIYCLRVILEIKIRRKK